MRSTFANIRLDNLAENYLNIREKVYPSKVMAVIKANAYGHGAVQAAKCYNQLGDKKPEYFAVAIIEEAVELRKAKIGNSILVFDPFNKKNAKEAIKYDVECTICNQDHLSFLEAARTKLGMDRKINIHIKIDTGMGRLGVPSDEAVAFIEKTSANPNFEIKGIYTHFSNADERDKTYAFEQLSKFKNIIQILKLKNINYGLAHCANSAAILDLPEAYLDMVRPGISLYGYYPSFETTESIQLKPVMELFSYISTIKKLPPETSISYNRRFRTKEDSYIATIPIGYADGINRHLTNCMQVIIGNKTYSQVGTVTMDRIMINLDKKFIKPGAKVIILGESKKLQITALDWCKKLNTIPYEVLCNISKRVPRVYKKMNFK